jgi:hypothetical protein
MKRTFGATVSAPRKGGTPVPSEHVALFAGPGVTTSKKQSSKKDVIAVAFNAARIMT